MATGGFVSNTVRSYTSRRYVFSVVSSLRVWLCVEWSDYVVGRSLSLGPLCYKYRDSIVAGGWQVAFDGQFNVKSSGKSRFKGPRSSYIQKSGVGR